MCKNYDEIQLLLRCNQLECTIWDKHNCSRWHTWQSRTSDGRPVSSK